MPHGLVASRSSAEIANALFISLRTATTRISHLCADLWVASGAERRATWIVSWLAAISRSIRLYASLRNGREVARCQGVNGTALVGGAPGPPDCPPL